jgi:ABC-2 type transport system ATP-binding protein
MILGWRDEGRTVVFSSHILSDAELLCSHVGILSGGRLAATGSLDQLTSVESRGWELVFGGLGERALSTLAPSFTRATRIAEARYSVEIPSQARPEVVIAAAVAAGASLVSVTPLRATLEDIFMRATGSSSVPAHEERP